MFNLLLGSKSPRRKELLRSLGVAFETVKIDVEENFPESMELRKAAEFLAEKKSNAYNLKSNRQMLITADTIVICKDRLYGKPKDKEEAVEMLNSLSGNKHEVITGVTIRTIDEMDSFSDSTDVYFSELSSQDIDYYVSNWEPFDKAGAYGIQEWIGMSGIERIEGDYFNVVGLPLHKLYTRLQKHFNGKLPLSGRH